MAPSNKEIADHFKRYGRARRRPEQRWYGQTGTLAEVVGRAVSSEDEHGKLNRHQRRNGRAALEVARTALLETLPALERCDSFESMHTHIAEVFEPLDRIGVLAIYDCAQRISVARRFSEPDVVYLHAGTAKGAASRGVRGRTANIREFPKEFWKFSSFELEDLLCNYARYLGGKELPDGPLPQKSTGR